MVEDVGRIAAGCLLVGLPDEELVEHHLVAGDLTVHSAVKDRARSQFAHASLSLFKRTKVGELADTDVRFGRGLVGALADETEAEGRYAWRHPLV